MPVRKVKGGYRWGNSGKLYPTQAQAERQGRAIYASGYADGGIASLGNETAEKPASNGIYDLWKKHVPMNARIFLQTLLGTPGKPITEKEFTSRELAEMEQVIQSKRLSEIEAAKYEIKRAQLMVDSESEAAIAANVVGYQRRLGLSKEELADKGQEIIDNALARLSKLQQGLHLEGDIQYGSYPSGDSIRGQVGTTLGRFTYTTDPATGERVVVDNYDFYNPDREERIKAYEAMNPLERAVKTIARSMYGVISGSPHILSRPALGAAELGMAYIGREGRPVRIAYDPSIEMPEDYRQGGRVRLI
jgi:hypothetical protein